LPPDGSESDFDTHGPETVRLCGTNRKLLASQPPCRSRFTREGPGSSLTPRWREPDSNLWSLNHSRSAVLTPDAMVGVYPSYMFSMRTSHKSGARSCYRALGSSAPPSRTDRRRVTANAVLTKFAGHCPRHRDDGALRRYIVQHHRRAFEHRARRPRFRRLSRGAFWARAPVGQPPPR
jgi:hypothetical protein